MTDTTCPAAETLAAYVDGRLDAAELARVSNHLVECDRCYESVAATVRFLSGGRRTENVNVDDTPPWALLPALLTATVMAIAMTVCLLLLGQGS